MGAQSPPSSQPYGFHTVARGPEESTPGADLLWYRAVLCYSLSSDSWAGNLVPRVVVGMSGTPWVVLGHWEGLMGFL